MIIAYIEDNYEDVYLLRRKLPSNIVIKHYKDFPDYLESETVHDFVASDFSTPLRTDENLKKAVQKEPCPFVFYTGGFKGVMEKDVRKTYEDIGVEGFFSKGVDKDNLLEALRLHDVYGQ
jgi:dihydrodipicolinate reductase